MTAIDFASFVDQLASVSGETILPFFRTALAVENKKAGGFDPVTAADRAAEDAMRVTEVAAEEDVGTPRACAACGAPTYAETCSFCRLKERVRKARSLRAARVSR